MKQLTVDSHSWHYKLAMYGALDEIDGRTDLCRYFWALVRGLLRAPLTVTAGVVAGALFVVFPALFILVWIQTGQAVPLGPDLLGITLLLAFALFILVSVIVEKRKALPGSELVAAGYRGWKEKTCVLVEVQ